MTTLKIKHNAGFFSCATIRLLTIMQFYNEHGILPDILDDQEQFAFYKKELSENIIPEFYLDNLEARIPPGIHYATYEPGEISFGDYSKLLYEEINPFIVRYFLPSERVSGILKYYEQEYNIDYDNTCAIFYRGNDKKREGDLVPYQSFIDKANEVLALNPNIKFLVQPDETEFLEFFTTAFPGRCFWFKETPHMRKKDSAIFYELPPSKKTEHGCNFLAAVLAMSKCKYVITHSGNGSMWLCLYRNNFTNVYQFITKHIY